MERRLERAEVAALTDICRAAPAALVEREGIALLEADGVTALSVRTLPGSRVHNRAYGVASPSDLDRVEAFFRERGCPYVLSTAPGASLAPDLEARGYTRGYAWMKFARDVTSVRATGALRVVEIGDESGAVFGEVIAEAFGVPAWVGEWVAALPGRRNWACFLAYAGEEPAGSGALYVAGDVGWLGFGAVLPGLRGRGGQAALLAARVDSARARGCTLLATETGVRVEGETSASYRNILRAGFVEAGARDNWVPPSRAG